jgi:hypothetical protein
VRDVSLSAQKFEDYADDRVAAPRRARTAVPPDFGPAPIPERPALARFLRRPRLGFSILVGIAGLALVGVPLNALFLQDGRHPAPLFGGRTLAPEPVQTAAKPAPRPAPADVARVAETEASKTETHARATKPEARSDAAALTAEILKSAPPAPAAAPAAASAKPAKKRETVASRDAIGSLLGAAPKPAAAAKPAAAPRPPANVPAPAAAAAPAAAGPDQNVVSAQRALQRLGYVVKPDGVMSPELRKTIEKFQRDNGLPATGQLGPQVVKLLSTRTASQH